MFKHLLLLFLLIYSVNLGAQNSHQWKWFRGDTTFNVLSNYGQQGTASDTSSPGARHSGAYWNDKEGNFWLFAGTGRELHHRDGNIAKWLRDLWKYDPLADQWTYHGGATVYNGTRSFYGTKGLPSVNNWPGSRHLAIFSADTAGRLWLYGGSGDNAVETEKLNDLWRFNPQTLEWTFLNGDTVGRAQPSYGTKGVAALSNKPGNRSQACSWVDKDNNFWLFGGFQYYTSGNYGSKNDLWKYNSSSDVWTWMSGDTVLHANGKYGEKGLPAVDNNPPSRDDASVWTDLDGNFWMFGGSRHHPQQSIRLNDLWKYNIQSGQWVWMSGDSIPNAYAEPIWFQNFPSTAYAPSARVGAQTWTFGDNYLWLFGGDFRNDLWKYNLLTNEWTWLKGEAFYWPIIDYGQKGVFSPTNQPGYRAKAHVWVDKNKGVWMFGGAGSPNATYNQGFINDFWQFNNVEPLPLRLLGFTGSVINNKTPRLKWVTTQERDLHHFILTRSINGRDFEIIDSVPAKNSFIYNEYSYDDYSLFDINSGQLYFRLKMVDKDGRSTLSNTVVIKLNRDFTISLYPNPASDNLVINFNEPDHQKYQLVVTDQSGRAIIQKAVSTFGSSNYSLDIRPLSAGVYTLTIKGDKTHSKQFIKK